MHVHHALAKYQALQYELKCAMCSKCAYAEVADGRKGIPVPD